jgi:hypothetical protein
MGYPKGSLPVGGELVGTLPSEHPPEHPPECLAVPCIFNSRLSSSFVDKVDIFTLELVLCGFIVCLDTEGAQVDFQGEDGLSPVHQKERRFIGGTTR